MTSPRAGRFDRFATRASRAVGHPLAFSFAVLSILVWSALGPSLGFSERWQLVVNTGTTIVTFLVVFLVQNSQVRHEEAMQAKLDELLRAVEGADDQRYAGMEEP
jgi:low affinity Fe/Cu permease